MITLKDFLQVAHPKKFLIGDIDNEQYAIPFWFELIEMPQELITLELRGWLDKQVIKIDVDKGILKLTIQ